MPPGCYEPANYTTICSMQAFMPPEEEAIVSGSFITCPLIYQASHPPVFSTWSMRTEDWEIFLSTFYLRVGESNCKVQHVLLLFRKGIGDLLIPLRVHYHMTRGTGESALTRTCCARVDSGV